VSARQEVYPYSGFLLRDSDERVSLLYHVLITIVKSNIVQARVPKCECWDLSVKTQQCFKYKILKVKMLDAGFNLS
jgi:hypothetical protein